MKRNVGFWLYGLLIAFSWVYIGVGIVFGMIGKEPVPLDVLSSFDAGEAAYVHVAGDNVIRGQMFMRRQDGLVLTCAGGEMLLVPQTRYSRERIGHLHGGTDGDGLHQGVKLEAPDPRYKEYMRRSTCNAQGDFSFNGLSDGRYFVIGSIYWEGSSSLARATMMRPVKVRGGETLDFLLTPRG